MSAKRGALVLAVVGLLASCGDDGGPLLLLTIESPVPLTQLDIVAVSTQAGGGAPVRDADGRLYATPQAGPFRAAIELAGPSAVRVHFVADGTAGESVAALRCYQVEGTIEDTVRLVVLTDDADGDGWAAGGPIPCDGCGEYACPAAGLADCNDMDPEVRPDAFEACGQEANCDGIPGECADSDMDGVPMCPPGETGPACDCDDTVDTIFPGASEACSDGIDQDCDGQDLLCDADGDMRVGAEDCDDEDPTVYVGADELCDPPGVDEDCDLRIDEGGCSPDDADGDGVPNCDVGVTPCDCNDCDPTVNPGAEERCADPLDEDCDGTAQVCGGADADGDGFVGMGGTDCDDDDPTIYPGAPDNCTDGIDQACTGGDQPCSADTDGDGWVEPAECEAPGMPITPGLVEMCDGLDNDCDGLVDETGGLFGCAAEPSPMEIDFETDLRHCGGCGMTCLGVAGRGDICEGGSCSCSTSDRGRPGPLCAESETCCPGGDAFEGCADLSTSMEACGTCDRSCNDPDAPPVADACVDGQCRCGDGPACNTVGAVCCGGVCRDLRSDEMNCGDCGVTCGNREVCRGGMCTCGDTSGRVGDGPACPSSQKCCGTRCKNDTASC